MLQPSSVLKEIRRLVSFLPGLQGGGRGGEDGGWEGGRGEAREAAASRSRRSKGGESSSRSAEKRSAEDEAADLPTKPTKMSKFGFAIGSQTARKAPAISIRLGASKPKETVPTLAPKTLSVAAAFNEDEDSERRDASRSKGEDEEYWKGHANISRTKLL